MDYYFSFDPSQAKSGGRDPPPLAASEAGCLTSTHRKTSNPARSRPAPRVNLTSPAKVCLGPLPGKGKPRPSA